MIAEPLKRLGSGAGAGILGETPARRCLLAQLIGGIGTRRFRRGAVFTGGLGIQDVLLYG